MIDHIGIDISDYERSKAFYKQALAPLNIEIIIEVPAEQTGRRAYLGMGKEGKAFFWFGEGNPAPSPIHMAFTAENRASVDAFYVAALAAGGKDKGAPGLRPLYHPTYYGAFIVDPDGNNLEAVCHGPS